MPTTTTQQDNRFQSPLVPSSSSQSFPSYDRSFDSFHQDQLHHPIPPPSSSINPPTATMTTYSPDIHPSLLTVNNPHHPLAQSLPLIASTQTSSSISSHPYSARRPARPITKCDRCRSRKSKCDSEHPCGPCRRSKTTCLYTEGHPTKGNLEGSSSLGFLANHHSIQSNPSSSLMDDRQNLLTKINLLHTLLQDVSTRQAIQNHDLILSLQTRFPSSSDVGCGIDLESDNVITHCSKLWLRKEPDQSFFKATHPALVKLRQTQVPRWQQSRRWSTWSDYQAKSKYQQLSGFDPSLLPEENECRELMRRFIVSCDWYFEILTEAEANEAVLEVHHYRHLGLAPTSPEQWTRIALALAVCRLTLACLDWADTNENEHLSRKRCARILNWCDLSVMALQRAGFDQNPTVEAMRVLIVLTSTIFFETDYGLMGCSPQMLKLHEVAVDVSERLNLHRDPPSHLSSKEKDDCRRMWWGLVTIDSHFYATGATSHGVLRLQDSDTKLPIARQVYANNSYIDNNMAYVDLRSARSRFELGKFNNRCCQLLAQRKPLATLSDIWRLDHDLVALEARVPDDQRLTSHIDFANFFQKPLRPPGPIDDALRNGQQIFYIGFWHIRSKIHRGLLYTDQTSSHSMKSQLNLDSHRDIVRQCSCCLLQLYRHTKLPTAFISAVASAALTLSLELIDQPNQPHNHEIRTIVLECFSRLQTNSSPIIGRACQVLEYFLDPSRPHVGGPRRFEGGLREWQEIDPSVQVFYEQSPEPMTNDRFTQEPPKAPENNESSSLASGSSGSPGHPNQSVHQTYSVSSSTNADSMKISSYPDCSSISEQPLIGLTNLVPHVTTISNQVLPNSEAGVPPALLQDNLPQSSPDPLFEVGFNGYSNNLQEQLGNFDAQGFQTRSSGSSNYLRLTTPPEGYGLNLEAVPMPMVPDSIADHTSNSKDTAFSTVALTPDHLQQQPIDNSWPERIDSQARLYDRSDALLASREVGPEIFNQADQFNPLHYVGALGTKSDSMINQNFSMDSNFAKIF